jgi:putative membrane-bound dehydrogenase-like protein
MIRLRLSSLLPVFAVLLFPVLATAQQPADNAVKNLKVAPGLEATLFAAEPMLLSPSDIDVDHLGRVWVCEVVNYRSRSGQRAEGDRILILEDTDHDGRADKQTVFYQGRDIDSALGICVLGNRVLVSVAPNVFVFTDEDGDGKADKKELLFSKVGQPQHDHSTHAFIFGPDGKLYWNVGNTGHAVHDKDGKPIVDLAGNKVIDTGHPYRNGMAFRCNPDGSDFEVLGWNFRNNYELAVDSFGTVWQSDNDDDGNRSVRINYVMEFGNYGYGGELNGSAWQSSRTNIETEISQRHWRQNDPGVVPNLLITGAGSPTGICMYEGTLLPKVFQNQVIHCDAGPNVCRSYPVTKDGAGYKAEMVSILDGIHDQWFRPSDVCVAPDGSLIVADWYDPGVGGHRMGDVEKGRIFRVAPPKTAYNIPKYDPSTIDGAITALKSPNLEARYLGWTALNKRGVEAEPALVELYKSANPRERARALWLLTKLEGRGREHIDRALADSDSDIRIAGLRAARELKFDMLPLVSRMASDKSPQVRRECAIALRGNSSAEAARLWADLAAQHDGHDRWYLEALGIGAAGNWDAYLAAWLKKVGNNWNTLAGQDIIWRSRASQTSEYLAKIINDPSTSVTELPRYFRAFDFQTGDAKRTVLVALAFDTSSSDPAKQALVSAEAVGRIEGFDVAKNPQYAKALNAILDRSRGSQAFVTLVEKFNLADRYPQLLAMAQAR